MMRWSKHCECHFLTRAATDCNQLSCYWQTYTKMSGQGLFIVLFHCEQAAMMLVPVEAASSTSVAVWSGTGWSGAAATPPDYLLGSSIRAANFTCL